MSERAPRDYVLEADIPADAAGASSEHVIGKVREAGFITAATIIPTAAITGADTDTRSLVVVNKGQDGTGTVEAASIDFVEDTDAAEYDVTPLELSDTEGALEVAEGDVLALESTHSGSGLAFPGGKIKVTLSRQA